jgi:hypothetical protein
MTDGQIQAKAIICAGSRRFRLKRMTDFGQLV